MLNGIYNVIFHYFIINDYFQFNFAWQAHNMINIIFDKDF